MYHYHDMVYNYVDFYIRNIEMYHCHHIPPKKNPAFSAGGQIAQKAHLANPRHFMPGVFHAKSTINKLSMYHAYGVGIRRVPQASQMENLSNLLLPIEPPLYSCLPHFQPKIPFSTDKRETPIAYLLHFEFPATE